MPNLNQSSINRQLENCLCDTNYTLFFNKFSRDQIKSFHFYDDIVGLEPRNAFKLDKKGDKNNVCFDQVHFKQLCKYFVPRSGRPGDYQPVTRSNKGVAAKRLTKKQLWKKQLKEAAEKRYFVRVNKILPDDERRKSVETRKEDLTQSALSNKMWLYLEMKSELEREYEAESQTNVDKTSDFMKYLDENKGDISKWLEFIDYQSSLRLSNQTG